MQAHEFLQNKQNKYILQFFVQQESSEVLILESFKGGLYILQFFVQQESSEVLVLESFKGGFEVGQFLGVLNLMSQELMSYHFGELRKETLVTSLAENFG